MGKTSEKVLLRNYHLASSPIEIEAIVDTGAAFLCLPPTVIKELALAPAGTRRVTTANGIAERKIFRDCEIKILGRDTAMEVMENDISTPPLIGYLVLEALDLIVNPKEQKIVPNPANDGKWMIDLY